MPDGNFRISVRHIFCPANSRAPGTRELILPGGISGREFFRKSEWPDLRIAGGSGQGELRIRLCFPRGNSL